MIDLEAYAPILVTVALLLGLSALDGRYSKVGRALAAALCIFLSLRYMWWHATLGMPTGQSLLQQIWAWVFFFFEAMAIFSAITVYFFMSRDRNRSSEADRHLDTPLHSAPVDVFIATYNEAAPILERTIIGAKAIDHADLRVWVLDDGARDWVRDLATELGALYLCRVNGAHAKAGNVNNGLRHALTIGRRPEFMLLLDADFIASRAILKRTLGLFDEPDVGIVQTPQHFFNPDPIQANLLCSAVWPDEQRFFFEVLLPCKDAWGAAFCCGTSSVFRVAALEASNGLATETVTEDMLTTFKLEEHGYRTIYLNEPLSIGLAPEGLRDYISQRSRWCLGAMQQIYTRWSFAGPARLRLISRFSSFDGAIYWIFSYPFKLCMMSAPMVFWWTGTSVIVAEGLLAWLGPSAVASVMFMAIYSRNRVLPIMTDVTQLLVATTIIRTVVVSLIKPWGHPFKVTAKGLSTDAVIIQWSYLAPFVAIIAGILSGMLINLSDYAELKGVEGYSVNVFWSLLDILYLTLAVAVCIELPRRRQEERFVLDERAVIKWATGFESACRLQDISLGGAQIKEIGSARGNPPGPGVLSLDDGAIILPFTPVRGSGADGLAVRFELDTEERRALIVKLFSGAHRNKVEKIDIARVLYSVGKKLLA